MRRTGDCRHIDHRLGTDTWERSVINKEFCKGCELCITACTFKLIRMGRNFNRSGNYYAELVDPEGRCTGCTLCAEMCPDVAIEVWKAKK